MSDSPETRVIEDPSEIARIEPAWQQSAARAGSPMQLPLWTRASLRAFSVAPHLLLVGSETAPEALLPLVRRQEGVGRLELAGLREVFEPMDALYREPAAVRPLVQALLQRRLPLVLGRVPARSPLVEALQGAARRQGVLDTREVAPTPFIRLGPAWETPERQLSGRRRSDLRRMERRAQSMGEIRWAMHRPTPESLGPLLQTALEVEARSWKGREGTAVLRDPLREPFIRALAEEAAASGLLRLALLHIGDRPAAMQLGIELRGRLWLLKIGYDADFARCSPGNLLLVRVLADCAARGLERLELLGTLDDWLRPWKPEERPCVAMRYYPPRPRGAAALLADAARLVARRARERRDAAEA